MISIIIPTRDRWEILFERALPSVRKQTYKNWQLIIIDDCSDVTPRIKGLRFGEWEYDDSRIELYRLEPKVLHYPDEPKYHWLAGPTRALNYGLTKVQSDWIARLDDDDEWEPDMLETMLSFARKGNYEFVSASWVNKKGWITNAYEENPKVGGVQTWLYRSYLKCFKYNLHAWRKPWDANNEIDLYKRMYKVGVRFGFLDKVVCTIRPRPGLKTIGLEAYLQEHK